MRSKQTGPAEMKSSSRGGIYDLRLVPMGERVCSCIPEPPTFVIGPPPSLVDFMIHQPDHRHGAPVDTFSCPQVTLDPQNINSPTELGTGHKLFGWIFVLLMTMIGVKLFTMCVMPAISTLMRQQYKRKGVKVSPPGPWGAKRHYLELDGKTNFRGPQDSPSRGSDWSYYSIRPISSRQPVKEESSSTNGSGRRGSKLCFWFRSPFQTESASRIYDQIQLDAISEHYPTQRVCEARCGRHTLARDRRVVQQGGSGTLPKRVYDSLQRSCQSTSICRVYKGANEEYLRSLESVRRVAPVAACNPLVEECSAENCWSPRYSTFSTAMSRTFINKEIWL